MTNQQLCNRGIDQQKTLETVDSSEMPTRILSSNFNRAAPVPAPFEIISQLMKGHVGRGRNGHTPEIITIHTQWGGGNPYNYLLGLGEDGPNAADCTIWNPAAASGKLVRYLNDSDTTWTNGGLTEPINHANPVLDKLYRQGVYSGDVALTVENEGKQSLTPKQFERLAQLCAWWCTVYGIPADRNHIVGHSEIGPHKQCPGFKLEPLVKRVQEIMGQSAPPPFDPNPQKFSVGAGMLAKLAELNLQASTNEQYFYPGDNQPGLMKISFVWTNVPGLYLTAYEQPDGTWDVQAARQL